MNKFFSVAVLILLGGLLFGILLSWPIQLLWNYALVNSIDGINPISFLQAYGIFVLLHLLRFSTSTNNSK